MAKPTSDSDIPAAEPAGGAAVGRGGSSFDGVQAWLCQTYVIMRDDTGRVRTEPGSHGEERTGTGSSGKLPISVDGPTVRCDLPSTGSVVAAGYRTDALQGSLTPFFDTQSVYLLAWQRAATRATVTSFSDEQAISSTTICVGSDPTRLIVNWNVVDKLMISYEGAPGFCASGNFLFV
jgi:hypothetical protein